MKQMLTVRVRVSKLVQQFVIAVYGSTTIVCGHNDMMTRKIKYLVSKLPKGYKLSSADMPYFVDIQVKDFTIGRYKDNPSGIIRKMSFNNNYIKDTLQRELAADLKEMFKAMFANYVDAYVRGANFRLGSQKDAILDFCAVYYFDCTQRDYETMKKIYQRYVNSKQKVKNMREKIAQCVPENFHRNE